MSAATALSILGGGAPSGGGGLGVAGPAAFRNAERQRETSLVKLERDPTVRREIQRFERALSQARTPEELLRNRDARTVLLTAFGLGDQINNTQLAIRALTSNSTDPRSDVARLSASNPNWLRANRQLDFFQGGLSRVADPGWREIFVDDFVEARWRENLNQQTPGLGTALTFKSRLDLYDNTFKLLGDKVSREVITKAFDIPPQFALQSLSSQKKLFERYVKPDQLNDPRFVDRLIERYLVKTSASGAGIGVFA